MRYRRRQHDVRAAAPRAAGWAVGAVLAGAMATRLGLLVWDGAPRPQALLGPEPGLAQPLLAVAAAVCALLLARLAACCAATALAVAVARRGHPAALPRRAALRLSPALLRPFVAAAVTGVITVGSIGPASAATHQPAPGAGATAGTVATASAAWPAPGWQPLPAAGWRATAPPPRPDRPSAEVSLVTSGSRDRTPDEQVVVRRGDCLWSLAARQLGAGASDAQIAAAWPRWWAANRAVIGDDPDLLLPGTRLSVPAATTGASAPGRS